MSTLTLAPNATDTMGGATAVEEASGLETTGPVAHIFLGDNTNNTYLRLDGTHTGVSFPTPNIPSGSRILAIFVNAIVASRDTGDVSGGAAGQNTLRTNLPDIPGRNDIVVTWQSPLTTIAYLSGDPTKNGAVTDWEVDLKNQAGNDELRVYWLRLLISYVARPAVTVSSPTGTIGNTSFPLTQWTWISDEDGGDVNLAEVKIFNDAQYGAGGFSPGGSTPFATSGLITGDGQSSAGGIADGEVTRRWRTTTKLLNDDYRAYVRVMQFGKSNWSNWAFHAFEVDVVPPADPSSVTVTPEPSLGRMRIEVVGSHTPRSVDAIEVERSVDGGQTWTALRSMGITPLNASLITWDFEAPIGEVVLYRARTLHLYSLGEWAASGWVTADEAQWDSADWWLKHPIHWERNREIKVRSQPSYTRTARQGIFTPMGRSDPVVVSDSRTLPSGEITFRTMTKAEQADLDALLDMDSPLLLQAPPDHNWPDRWVTFGDHTRERVIDNARLYAWETLPWQEVARPTDEVTTEPPVDPEDPTHLKIPFDIGDTIQ